MTAAAASFLASFTESAKSDPTSDFFKFPYAHALMNANLARIQLVDPARPDEPAQNAYEGHGVRANIIITGIAATISSAPDQGTHYGVPDVSLLLDVFVLGDDHEDCLVLSTIAAPFAAGTTNSHAITDCNKPPNLLSDVASYVIDQVEISALVAAMNSAHDIYNRSPLAIRLMHDSLFTGFDKALRNDVGDDINKALPSLHLPIPFVITTKEKMSPFLVFTVPSYNLTQKTIDINFDAIGFSTIIETVDPQSGKVLFGSAISIMASGQAHLSTAGLTLTLNYKANAGTGLLPLAPKYASAINNAIIPKLEAFLHTFFPKNLDEMLGSLTFFPP